MEKLKGFLFSQDAFLALIIVVLGIGLIGFWLNTSHAVDHTETIFTVQDGAQSAFIRGQNPQEFLLANKSGACAFALRIDGSGRDFRMTVCRDFP